MLRTLTQFEYLTTLLFYGRSAIVLIVRKQSQNNIEMTTKAVVKIPL